MNIFNKDSLIDRKELVRRYPALGAKKYRVDYLIRRRAIPLTRINRNIYFNPRKIDEWIRENEINVRGEK